MKQFEITVWIVVSVMEDGADDEPNEAWYLIEQHFGVDTRS